MRTVIAVAALIASAGVGAGVAAVAVHESTGSTTTTVIRRPVTVNAAPAASTTATGALSVSEIYQRSIDGVVEVLATGSTRRQSFFGGQETESAQGTGFEVDRKGDIVTNYHVVDNSDSVRVRLNDGHTYGGRVIGVNHDRDVAVIRISAPPSELHPLRFADSSAVQVGDSVVAIGDPYGLRNTVTAGHRERAPPHDRLAQQRSRSRASSRPTPPSTAATAAARCSTPQGQVIGVNSQIESGSQGGGAGRAATSASASRSRRTRSRASPTPDRDREVARPTSASSSSRCRPPSRTRPG